jgi:hypothetical protein
MKKLNLGKGLGEKHPHANHCLYGTWRQFTLEEKEAKARRIYNRNSKGVRRALDVDQERVLKKGIVEEQDLRDKKTRQLLGMPTKIIPIRK